MRAPSLPTVMAVGVPIADESRTLRVLITDWLDPD
jgi:hypothetical protein